MQYLNDYPDTAPTTNPTNLKGFSNYSTVPYLSFTATPTGWSAGNINGTTSPQEKLNSVAYTSFVEVNSLQ